MRFLERLVRVLDTLVGALSGALVAALMLVILAQVFFRFVLNDSLLWSEELGQYLNVAITFLGAALVMLGWCHTNVPLFVYAMPEHLRPWVMVPVKFVTAGFVIFLIVVGGAFVVSPFHLNSPSMGFSTRWVKLCIPIAGVLMLLFFVHSIARDIIEFRRRNFKHFAEQGQLSLD